MFTSYSIGLGQQQDKAWNKINGDKDVPIVQGMLKSAGFKSVTTLVNQQATKAGIIGAFKRMAASCKQGDVVYIHYSGHGQQMTDVHNDETDWTSAGFRMMPIERLARHIMVRNI